MKGGAPTIFFAAAISLLLILNLYQVQNNNVTYRNTNIDEQILDKINNIKCPVYEEKICPEPEPCIEKTCEPYVEKTCPQIEPCVEKTCPKPVIKMREMTKVLNERDITREAVFFTETSGTGRIKPRFVCGLESAAKVYQDADVYLLVAYNPTDELKIEWNEALNSVLLHHDNVQVLYVDMDLLFIGTPLENFHQRQILNNSKFLSAHTSDVVRFLTLWLYGGKYFDMDVITVKNLTGLNNFIIDESKLPSNYIANGFFAYEKHSPVGDFIFKMLNNEFHGNEWADNGPRMMTDAMRWYTNVNLAIHMNSTNLKEFSKIRYDRVFPIEWFELLLYFDESKSIEALNRIGSIGDLIAMHIGNNNIKGEKVYVGSKQAYSVIAQQYCPRSYWSAHKIF